MSTFQIVNFLFDHPMCSPKADSQREARQAISDPQKIEPRSGEGWNRSHEMSVAPPGLESGGLLGYLGLTPQAMHMSLLRSFSSNAVEARMRAVSVEL